MLAQHEGLHDRTSLTGTLVLVLALAVVMALVGFSLVARAARPGVERPRLVSMQESARALERAGQVMQTHGQAMLTLGQRAEDQDLIAHGEHRVRDGQALSQRAQWLAMDPLAPSSLVTSPGELSRQGSWGELTRTAAAMLHDPSRARAVDLEALRWNGLAMQAEGRMMAEHGQLMVEEAELMVARAGQPERGGPPPGSAGAARGRRPSRGQWPGDGRLRRPATAKPGLPLSGNPASGGSRPAHRLAAGRAPAVEVNFHSEPLSGRKGNAPWRCST